MRSGNRLSAVKIARLTEPGRYCDGHGLWLQVGPGGSKAWLFRYMRNGSARQMGLGPLHTVGLARARDLALQARQVLRDGGDPIEARKETRQAEKLHAAALSPLGIALRGTSPLTKRAGGIRSIGRSGARRWRPTPIPRSETFPFSAVDTALVLRILEPIWGNKRETAGRLRGRIEEKSIGRQQETIARALTPLAGVVISTSS